MQTLQDMLTVEDFDVSDAFQHSRSTESVKSAASETYMSKINIAKRRANQQETEMFYFTVSGVLDPELTVYWPAGSDFWGTAQARGSQQNHVGQLELKSFQCASQMKLPWLCEMQKGELPVGSISIDPGLMVIAVNLQNPRELCSIGYEGNGS